MAKIGTPRQPSLADETLVFLVESGDPEALAGLYDRHAREAYSLARRMLRDRQAAEDLVQDVFLKVWRSAGSYRPERGSVRTWILSMAKHRGIDHLRSSASRRRLEDRIEVLTTKAQQSEAFLKTWRNLRREQVLEALQTLPREQMKILELAYLRGHTHAEIAKLLELPLGTVKGRIRLGLKKMGDQPGILRQAEAGLTG